MNPTRPLTATVILLAASTVSAGVVPVFSDDFNDGLVGPQWTQVTDNPSDLFIIDEDGRLGIESTGLGSNNDDALYLSNGTAGFRLSTADPFNIQLDYEFATTGDLSSPLEGLAVVLGVGEDLDGQNSAAIGYGTANAGIGNLSGASVAYRVNDAQTVGLPNIAAASQGTFVISYTPGTDTLTFATDTTSESLPGVVQGLWGADSLFVSFGARGTGFSTDRMNSFADNFQINTGTLVAIPEPASLGLIALGGLTLRRRR